MSEREMCNNTSCPSSPQIKLYHAVIFATPILFTLVVILLFCTLYIRRRRIARINSQITAQFVGPAFVLHPLEHGLSESFRKGLPVILFDEKFASLRADNQCPVCLEDYELDEKLHHLPLCGHTFHVECIDEWLTKNTTCPICRTSLMDETRGAPNSSSNIQSGSNGRFPVRASQRWEDMILNEHQEGVFDTRMDTQHGDDNHVSVSVSDSTLRVSNDHSIDIERS